MSEYVMRYGLTRTRASAGCSDHALIMHPGPMNRGVEIASEVADGTRSITEQVRNGVPVRMAVLFLLLGSGRHRPTNETIEWTRSGGHPWLSW
jgi:aspartate carbamoyltransferase catalytic subunit